MFWFLTAALCSTKSEATHDRSLGLLALLFDRFTAEDFPSHQPQAMRCAKDPTARIGIGLIAEGCRSCSNSGLRMNKYRSDQAFVETRSMV